MNKTMRLITSSWEGVKTFRMIPETPNCPYNEVIYNPKDHFMAIISKDKKDALKFIPRLDDNGDVEMVKRSRSNGIPYKEQRVSIETYYEYYIEDQAEIVDFIKSHAVNAEHFNYSAYLKQVVE